MTQLTNNQLRSGALGFGLLFVGIAIWTILVFGYLVAMAVATKSYDLYFYGRTTIPEAFTAWQGTLDIMGKFGLMFIFVGLVALLSASETRRWRAVSRLALILFASPIILGGMTNMASPMEWFYYREESLAAIGHWTLFGVLACWMISVGMLLWLAEDSGTLLKEPSVVDSVREADWPYGTLVAFFIFTAISQIVVLADPLFAIWVLCAVTLLPVAGLLFLYRLLRMTWKAFIAYVRAARREKILCAEGSAVEES